MRALPASVCASCCGISSVPIVSGTFSPARAATGNDWPQLADNVLLSSVAVAAATTTAGAGVKPVIQVR